MGHRMLSSSTVSRHSVRQSTPARRFHFNIGARAEARTSRYSMSLSNYMHHAIVALADDRYHASVPRLVDHILKRRKALVYVGISLDYLKMLGDLLKAVYIMRLNRPYVLETDTDEPSGLIASMTRLDHSHYKNSISMIFPPRPQLFIDKATTL